MIFDREHYIKLPVPIEKELIALFDTKATITIFEIGACEGEDSIRYANLFPNSSIYAFEPLPQNFEKVKANILRYEKNNITAVPLALSNTAGVSVFYVSSGTPEGQEANVNWDFGNKSSSLLPPDKHIDIVKFIDFKQSIEIETLTLDSFCENNQIYSIDFVHMDVQGAELMVLQGAEQSISKIKAIWLEVSKVTLYQNQPLSDDIEKFMSERNFAKVKDTVDDITGDQFYVSKAYFPDYEQIFSSIVPDTQNQSHEISGLRMLGRRIKRKLFSFKKRFFK